MTDDVREFVEETYFQLRPHLHVSMPELLQPTQNATPFSRPETPNLQPLKVGFVGLGRIGYLMARNLAEHFASNGSPPLWVWNRTVSKSEELLASLGQGKIRIADDPEQVALECDIVITNLANDVAVKSVYDKFTSALLVGFIQRFVDWELTLCDLQLAPPDRNKIFVESGTVSDFHSMLLMPMNAL